MNEYGKPVTFRLLKQKEKVYEDFKAIVIDDQHGDVCYVLTMLMEAYTNAIKQVPNNDKLELVFPRQTVQINMGCNFNYYTKKARRLPNPQDVNIQKNYILPNLIEQWSSLKPEAKDFWVLRLKEAGIIEDTPLFPVEPSQSKKTFLQRVMEHCKAFVSWLWGLLRGVNR